MENLKGQRRRPAQRLYVPPAQRCQKNNEIISENGVDDVGMDARNSLEQRLEAVTLSDDDLTPSRTATQTVQIDTNNEKTLDAENEEMNRAMVNMNRKSSRPIIKHTTNYLPTNDILQISTEPERTANKVTTVKTNTNNQVSNWEDLINEDCDGKNFKHNDSSLCSYDDYDDAEEAAFQHRLYNHNLSDLDHVIELFDFPASFRTQDLITLYNFANSESMYIKWCDDTHALLVFGTAAQALRALEMKHDIVKCRPVTLASSIALQTIEKCDLRPHTKRPQTSMHTARRMITSALGAKSNVSKETQLMEREALKKAKEMKRTQKQNEQDAWEGNPRPSTA